jgi:hypothetical protein
MAFTHPMQRTAYDHPLWQADQEQTDTLFRSAPGGWCFGPSVNKSTTPPTSGGACI